MFLTNLKYTDKVNDPQWKLFTQVNWSILKPNLMNFFTTQRNLFSERVMSTKYIASIFF